MSSSDVFRAQQIRLAGISTGNAVFGRSGIIFEAKSGNTRVESENITEAKWMVFGRKALLEVTTKNLKKYRYDGFGLDDYQSVKDFFTGNTHTSLEKVEGCGSGANFGKILQNENVTSFVIGGKVAFETGMDEISQCVLPGNTKNEIELQFAAPEGNMGGDDNLVSMRITFPEANDAEAENKDEEAEVAEADGEIRRANSFQTAVTQRSGTSQSSLGSIIVEISSEHALFATPRGKYIMSFYDSHMQIHGQKYVHNIKYDDISMVFKLPRPDQSSEYLVLCLSVPISQGNSSYPILVLQLTKKDVEINFKVTQEVLNEKYEGKLSVSMRGSIAVLLAKIFKLIGKRKVYIEGNFQSSSNEPYIRCSEKTNNGQLFLHSKLMLFLPKPTLIQFDDIDHVEYERLSSYGTSTRQFDLKVLVRSRKSSTEEKMFTAIDKADYDALNRFLRDKEITASGGGSASKQGDESALSRSMNKMAEDDDDEDDDDEEGDVEYKPKPVVEEEDDDDDEEEEADSDEANDEDIEAGSKRKLVESKSSSSSSKPRKTIRADNGEKKKKKKKDKNAPKGAKNGFTYFKESIRAQLKSESPNLSFGDFARLSSERWKALGDKSSFEAMAVEDKKRYKKQMETYVPPINVDDDDDDDDDDNDKSTPKKSKTGKDKKPKKIKDKNAPKKNKSAYLCFTVEQQSIVRKEGFPQAEVMSEVARRWKAVDAIGKKKYEAMAAEDKIRYDRQIAEYNRTKSSSSSSVATPVVVSQQSNDDDEDEEVLEEEDDDDA